MGVAEVPSLMSASVDVARGQVGVREDPLNSNEGPQVDAYLRSVGMAPGLAWCAAFCYWCIREAWWWDHFGQDPPFIRTAWTPSIWSWAQGQGLEYWASPTDVHLGREVPDGALFLLHGSVEGVRRVNHVGFVAHLDVQRATIGTVEGNTNPAGSREGGGVYERERPLQDVYRFVMYGAGATGQQGAF
uniref:Peptidase C51 domain-containing protein n=1 Tax=viral metagenome TaxID=1070528 RepID=A0A6M3KM79_9ZZZZ